MWQSEGWSSLPTLLFHSLSCISNALIWKLICVLLQDLFTVGLGWLLFGGLPFDVVSSISFPFCNAFLLSQLIKFQAVSSPVEYYRPSSWFRGLRFLRILQDQGEVAFHQLNLVNAKPLMAPIQMDSQRSNEIHITAARVPLTVHIKFWLHLFNFLCMISTPSDTIDILCFRNRTLDIEDIIIYVGSLYGLLSCKLSIVCDSNKI